MRILFINNDGGGFAEDCLIRIDRQPTSVDQVLQEGDRISMTLTKIQGRRRPF